jgi:hypothetical protein
MSPQDVFRIRHLLVPLVLQDLPRLVQKKHLVPLQHWPES